MGGLLVLGLIALYLWGAYKVVARLKLIWAKLIAIVILALVPTADAVYGRIRLAELCEKDGGVRVLKDVKNIEGFYSGDSVPDDEWITKHGFKFVEGKSIGLKFVRKEMGPNGKVLLIDDVVRKSALALDHVNDDLTKAFRYNEIFLYEIGTNSKVASQTNITFRGGWVERVTASIYARTPISASCNIETGDVVFANLVLKY